MNEPTEKYIHVAFAKLIIIEKFHDEGLDVLLFIDNIYIYTLQGIEV